MQRIDSKRAGLFLLALVGAIFAGTLIPPKVRAASGTSYTVVRSESGFDQAGTLKYTIRYVEALRGDGSYVKSRQLPSHQERTIYFAHNGEVRMNEGLGRKSTYPGRYAAELVKRDPAASCLSDADRKLGFVVDGVETVGGHRAFRLVQAGAPRGITAWYASDVDCALVQLRFAHETGVTVQKLDSLTLAEPDPALFQVPTQYVEGPPSELYDCPQTGGCQPLPETVKQRIDGRYAEIRAQAR